MLPPASILHYSMSQNIPIKLFDWIHENNINWHWLSRNHNAIQLLEQNQDKIDWDWISTNPNAIHLLEQNPDKINWILLSENRNAIHLLEQNPDKICWFNISKNPNAIHIFEQNLHKIDWNWISYNSAIFTYDYAKMKHNHIKLKEELIMNALSPSRISIWLDAGVDIDDL